MVKKNVDLIGFTHNRDAHYKIISDEIFNLINNYTNQEEILPLYRYFETRYQLPKSVVEKKIRQYIARSYLLRSGKFDSKLHIKNTLKYVLRYGTLVLSLFFARRQSKVQKFKLIIDGIDAAHELNRFEKLLNLVGKENTLCVTRDIDIKQEFSEAHIYNKKILHDLNLVDLLKSIVNEFFIGIWVVLKASIRTKVNLFPATLNIIYSYLSFRSIFMAYQADFLIQERHYDTDPVKNYLFKQFGGIASTSIQKNIFQFDPMFFYTDIDVLFSLGDSGYEDFIKYDGRIAKINPVGSMFMEHYWFGNKHNIKKKYDIVVLGINTSNAYERLDSYNQFTDDYYSLYQWVSKLSIDNPEYNIVLKHHSSAGEDDIENRILAGSNVKVVDKSNNSYEAAFSSKVAVTYGSTMGYELNAHGLPTFFIDPGGRCSFLPIKECDYIDKMRVESYDSFCLLMDKVLSKGEDVSAMRDVSSMWCLESSEVSDRIHSYFKNEKTT